MIGFLSIISASALTTAIFLICQGLGGRALGAHIEEVNFFFLGPIFKVRVAGIRWSLGYFPSGGSVKFSDEFQNFHPLRKIAIACCGLFSYVLIALIGLGFDGALHSVATGYGQLLNGALSPLHVGSRLVSTLAGVFQSGSYGRGLGILAAKFFALNSLPVGAFSGGFIVLWLLEAAGLRSEKLTAGFQSLGLVVILLLLVAWAVATVGAASQAL